MSHAETMREPLDLSNCEREPIHIPGLIQPHGVLLVADARGLVRQRSRNALELFSGEVLGAPLADLLPESVLAAAEQVRCGETPSAVNPIALTLADVRLDAVVHGAGDAVIIELERVPAHGRPPSDFATMAHRGINRLQHATSIRTLMQVAAEETQRLCGFSRVMAYRFHADGSGEVVAETLLEDLESYLGLRYPASDIPAQARRLYTINPLRLIADAAYLPVPIEPTLDPDTLQPVDLSHSVLRSVSPIHVEYLRNIGTAASMSISILVDGELWGLIACHHTKPRQVEYSVRMACELIGRNLGILIEREASRERAAFVERVAQAERDLFSGRDDDDVIAEVAQGSDTLLALLDATGGAISYDNRVELFGSTPPREVVVQAIRWLKDHCDAPVFATERLGDVLPPAAEHTDVASGLLASIFHRERAGMLVWFRPELARTVRWAGDPRKATSVGPSGARLTPRGSFAEWRETVRGASAPWRGGEREAAMHIREVLTRRSLHKAAALERTRDLFLSVLGHDLRNPLNAVLLGASVLAAEADNPELTSITSRISASSMRMKRMVDQLLDLSRLQRSGKLSIEPREHDLHALVGSVVHEAELALRGATFELTRSGDPRVACDGDRIQQVISNLLSNARHHGQIGAPVRVDVRDEAEGVAIAVHNDGAPIPDEIKARLFEAYAATESTARHSKGLGLGLYIARAIVEGHGGTITFRSEPDEGTTFTVLLPRTARPEA